MGLSVSATFAVLIISVAIAFEIFTGAILPTFSDISTSLDDTKQRGLDEVQSKINITGLAEGETGTWWNTSFGFRKNITIDHTKVAGDLANFPVLIDITDASLKNQVLQSNGNDIAFVNSTHTTKYNHEIELYNSDTGHLVAWVNITAVSSTVDTSFYMYYGNATCENQQNSVGVWDSSYKTVHHMEGSSSPLDDSTSNNRDMTLISTTMNSSSKIDGGRYYDGIDDISSLADNNALDFGTSDFTIEVWVKQLWQGGVNRRILGKWPTGMITAGTKGWCLWLDTSGRIDGVFSDGTAVGLNNGNDNLTEGWHHVVSVFDRNSLQTFYVDGVNAQTTDISERTGTVNNTYAVTLMYYNNGMVPGTTHYYTQGDLDEIRLSNTVRSAAWVNTSYQNQNSPSTFYSVGDLTTICLTITVENTGSISLDTQNFTILVNGTHYQSTSNRSYLFPLNEVQFYTTTQVAAGSKRIKIVSEIGTEDYYEYSG